MKRRAKKRAKRRSTTPLRELARELAERGSLERVTAHIEAASAKLRADIEKSFGAKGDWVELGEWTVEDI